MKRVLSLILVAVMVVSIFAGLQINSNAIIESGKCGKNVKYEYNTDTQTLTISGSGAMDDYVFYGGESSVVSSSPFAEAGYIRIVIKSGVTSIGDYAFAWMRNLASVSISASVTRIGKGAFINCESIEQITVPNGVKIIDDRAFDYCLKLKNISIPNSVTTIGNCAFDCSGIESIIIPDSVTDFGSGVFNSCSKLTNVTLPQNLTELDEGTFSSCIKLKELSIPSTVTAIGDRAFGDCRSLEIINIPNNVTVLGEDAFSGCEKLQSLQLGNTKITSIGAGAFWECKSLVSITLPASLTTVGKFAFMNCVALNSIIIPDLVSEIDEKTFYGCNGLTSVLIPDSVKSIGNEAFRDCRRLTIITIPDSVRSIGASAFSGCSSLTSITIPDSVTSIGGYAFYGSAYFNDSNNWENDVLYIGNHLISAKSNLLGKYDIKPGTKTIAGSAFDYREELTSVTIPDSVTSIGSEAFYRCRGLTSVTIGNSVKSISSSAFYGCSGLTGINIPNSVTSIGKSAFYNCSGLTSINIPNGVTSIGGYAFGDCSGLTNITINNKYCEIYDASGTIYSSATIYGYTGSTAQTYATKYGRTFVVINEDTDTTKPIGSISSTNNVAASQTATLTLSDDKGVAGYYWGTNSNYSSNTYTSASAGSITKTVSNSGTYYLTVKDTSGNISDTVSVTYYKTTLNANSGSVSPASVLTKSGNSFTFPTPTRSGYTYQGWNTSSTATSGVKTLSPSSNTTYYAVWKQNEVADTTKPTGSISSTNNVAASQTATLTLGDDKGVAGYYWGTNSNYSSNTYTTASAGSITKTVSNSGTYYLTVKDTSGNISDTVSVTYYKTTLNANSGSVSPASVLTKSGNSFTFPTPTRSGYTYQGWNTSSTATSGVKTLSPNSNTTYYAVWKSGSAKNPFQWGKDNWNFYNSSYNGEFSDSTYRSQINSTYQNVLKNNLTNSEYQCVFKGDGSWLDEKWGGSCYGMSSTVLLSKAGLLPYSSYKSNANCLYQLNAPASVGINSPSSTANVSSLITYYQMLQVKDVIQQQYRSVPQKSNKENITNLISLLDKNDTVLIGFQKSGWGGHAILAYGYEYGSYSKNGVTYQGRIKICDPNHSVSNDDNYYIYFNTSSYNWTIPAYSLSGINSTKGATFNYIGANVNHINKGGYLSSSSNATTDNYIARIDAKEISDNRSITKVVNNNGAYANHSSAPGEIVEDYSYVLGDKNKGTIGYNLYDADSAYKVMQEDATDLALAIDYEKCMLSGSSKAGESVVFDDEGYVSLTSESADYSVGMTFDDNYPTDWFAIEVTGENANEVELEKESNGWVLEADNLQNVTVNTNNKTDEACASFSTEYDSVLIYEINKNTIGVSVDTDNNGSYETRINTTKSVGSTTVSLAQSTVYYDGSAKEPTVTVKDGDKTLVKNRDYIVIYSNNTNIGVGTVTIVGMGDYSGTKELKFNIVCNHKMQAKVVAPKATKVGYTEYKCSTCGEWKKDAKGNVVKDSFTSPTGKPAGFKCASRTSKAMKFTWTKTSGVSGYQIQLLNSAGKAVATKTTTGNTYSFAALTAAHAYKARVRFYIKAADGNNYYGAWSTITSPTLPKETKVSSLTAAKKAFTAKWGKVSGVTGYQLQYSVNAKFSKATTKTVKGATKVKLAVKSLKGGTKYFVRVRTYKTVGGKNYYSTWSATKSVRTK